MDSFSFYLLYNNNKEFRFSSTKRYSGPEVTFGTAVPRSLCQDIGILPAISKYSLTLSLKGGEARDTLFWAVTGRSPYSEGCYEDVRAGRSSGLIQGF
jgi:hypothetical protein